METNIICHFLLILALACFIVCAAIQWHVFRSDFPEPTTNSKRNHLYQIMGWIYAGVFLVLAHVLTVTDREIQSRSMWRFLYYGVAFFLAVLSSNNNIAFLNDSRQVYNATGAPDFWKKSLAALIIGYFGLWIGMWVVHGNFKIRSWLAVIMYCITVILGVIGFVILWTLKGSTLSTFVLDNITIPLIVMLIFLSGPVFHEHLDGGLAACFVIGFNCLWFLSSGFALRDIEESTSTSNHTLHKAWAGTLFCWFSAFAAIPTARFALDVPIVNA